MILLLYTTGGPSLNFATGWVDNVWVLIFLGVESALSALLKLVEKQTLMRFLAFKARVRQGALFLSLKFHPFGEDISGQN